MDSEREFLARCQRTAHIMVERRPVENTGRWFDVAPVIAEINTIHARSRKDFIGERILNPRNPDCVIAADAHVSLLKKEPRRERGSSLPSGGESPFELQ